MDVIYYVTSSNGQQTEEMILPDDIDVAFLLDMAKRHGIHFQEGTNHVKGLDNDVVYFLDDNAPRRCRIPK